MATYFHGNTSEIQSSADGLQTLYLMNPTYVPYSDAPPNMLLLNPNTPSHALNFANLSHAPPLPSPSPNQQHQHQHQHLIHSTNILGSTNSDEHIRPSHHDITAFHGFSTTAASSTATAAPLVHYNLWGSVIDQPQPTIPSSSSASAGVSPQMGFRQPSQQGLSLSLNSSQQTAYRSSLSGELEHAIGNSPSSVSNNGISSVQVQGVMLGSKYLKAAQKLLDEVVYVGKGIYKEEFAEGSNKEKVRANKESTSSVGDGSESSKQVAELSTAQRQELQMKKSKLVTMLHEVEQRYRQYRHQMQNVVSSFEHAAGFGAAKSYTALALKTISKQFRCLKDAISSQIRATSKTLGEDDCSGVKLEGSRLRYVDYHIRQQRALQQLGMMQPNAWRPQRGLPERAVSVLRAWLFEHFLHPYPKDSDKVMLARQTGLTRSQVSNWYINARVRLWKPMVEEMYMEEIKEQEHNSGSNNTMRSKESSKELNSTENATPETGTIKLDQIKVLQSKQESFNNNQNTLSPTSISTNSSMSTSPMGGSLEMKHGDTNREANTTNFGIERHHKDGYAFSNENHCGGGYGVFSMEDIGRRFHVTEQLATRFHGNGVSLTLGLPHNENLPISGTPHGFFSQNINSGRRIEMGTNGNDQFCAIDTTQPSSIDIQNRKRFAAQLLPDFVA